MWVGLVEVELIFVKVKFVDWDVGDYVELVGDCCVDWVGCGC